MDNPSPLSSPRAAAGAAASRVDSLWRSLKHAARRYADWLATQSWKRLALLGLLLLIGTAILSDLPPFSTKWGEDRTIVKPARKPAVVIDDVDKAGRSYEVTIDERGVRVTPRPAPTPAPAASAPASAALPSAEVKLPPGADSDDVREAIEEVKREIKRELREAKPRTQTVPAFRLGDHLPSLAMLLIVASIIAKVMGAGRQKAEAQAAVATERADAESLKRQVIEARMAAMQAQVEPHFLFNTLASIDHLIETDPQRASTMQKNLIALLRASMPTMREANAGGLRELARELAVIRPYLEILKVRMEDRLQFEIDVPEGLLSAQFPPMMIQSLVENAIKHGLESKPEGGRLTVKAEIRHGKLAVTVADTGLGFGRAATNGTGVGLANIRERLQILYGDKAALTVAENAPSGTVVTLTVPYTHRDAATIDA